MFCPGCGVPVDDRLMCACCGRGFQDLMFHLIELHPHDDGHGQWR
jgi:hypothetical protein